MHIIARGESITMFMFSLTYQLVERSSANRIHIIDRHILKGEQNHKNYAWKRTYKPQVLLQVNAANNPEEK